MSTVHCETKCERDKKLQCCKSHINVLYIVHYKVSGSLNVHQKEQGHTQLATWACKVTENRLLQRENVSWGVCLCLGSCDTRITEQKFSSERRERTAVFPLRLINPGLSEYEGEWRGSPEQGEGPPAISATDMKPTVQQRSMLEAILNDAASLAISVSIINAQFHQLHLYFKVSILRFLQLHARKSVYLGAF